MAPGIGFTENLYGMNYFIWQKLIELQSAAQAIRDNPVRVHRSEFFHQGASQLNGSVMKIPFEPHNAGQAAAVKSTADHFQTHAGYAFEQFGIGLADLLFS